MSQDFGRHPTCCSFPRILANPATQASFTASAFTQPPSTELSDATYQLIDFGDGRKLESLAGYVIDRPSPAADATLKQMPERWSSADARFDSREKRWQFIHPWPAELAIDCDGFQMPVRATPYGHIGLFPEQADNWKWLRTSAAPPADRIALNLFGYTGASTIAMASSGYQVAHVDAARPNVQATRSSAELNGLADAPIRYLVDDAAKFVSREVRRGRRYETIVLDPPAYGHAPRGKAWRLERDLWPLLEDCLRLIDPMRFRILITGHSPQVDESDAVRFLMQSNSFRDAPSGTGLHIESGRSQLKDYHGRSLDAGFFVRVSRR